MWSIKGRDDMGVGMSENDDCGFWIVFQDVLFVALWVLVFSFSAHSELSPVYSMIEVKKRKAREKWRRLQRRKPWVETTVKRRRKDSRSPSHTYDPSTQRVVSDEQICHLKLGASRSTRDCYAFKVVNQSESFA